MTDAAAALRAFALLLVATPGSLSYNQPLPPPSQAPSTVAREGAGNGLDRRAALSAATAAVTAGGVILPGTAASAAAAALPTTMLGDLEVSQTIQGYWQLAGAARCVLRRPFAAPYPPPTHSLPLFVLVLTCSSSDDNLRKLFTVTFSNMF